MKRRKGYILCILLLFVVVIMIFIISGGKNSVNMDVNLQYFDFDKVITYQSEMEDLNKRETEKLKQDMKNDIDHYGFSTKDTFLSIEFTPHKSDDILDKVVLFACMNSDGKILPLSVGDVYYKNHKKNKHYYQCFYHMTYDFSTERQITYDIEGQVTKHRFVNGEARYEDDILVSETVLATNVYANQSVEKEDILLTFKETGTVNVNPN